MNVVREIQRLNEKEAKLGVAAGTGASWHDEYKGHPYVFVGNVPFELTEGDLVKIFSQYDSQTPFTFSLCSIPLYPFHSIFTSDITLYFIYCCCCMREIEL
jgi:hypothetical protein